jgi:amino acid transporter
VPGAPWLMLIPILLSTAGGLWLTSYILTRALFAMGRERLIPAGFGRLNRHHVPHVAIVGTLGSALIVVAVQLFVTSLTSFFTLVLSAAGFFLLAEFFLDSLTGAVFLTWGHRKLPDVQINPHGHRLLLVGSLFSTVIMGALLVAFFFYGPKAIGGGVDQTFAVLLALGAVFAWATRKRATATHVFTGTDLIDRPRPPAVVAARPDAAAG